MQGKKLLCLLAILAMGCCSGLARLGETQQMMQARYGAPVASDTLSGYTRCQYQRQIFVITAFFQNGVSVLETFATRGMDQETAQKVVALVAGQTAGGISPAQEDQIRRITGITCKDEVFWTWYGPAQVDAAFNPVECTVCFFEDPGVYAGVHQALLSGPLAGS